MSVTKPVRPRAKQAESSVSPRSRKRSHTPAPSTSQSDTPSVLKTIPAKAGPRCSATKPAISAAFEVVDGKSNSVPLSNRPMPTLPTAASAKPRTPATPASFMPGMLPGGGQAVDYPEVMAPRRRVPAVQGEVGQMLREWRERRRRSQLDLALDAGVSTRHLSFVETGRSKPGRDMLLTVLRELDVPFREQNQLLLAAGHAPAFPEGPLDHPLLAPLRDALALALRGQEPYPAVAFDRGWNLVAANSTMWARSALVKIARRCSSRR